MKYTKEVLKSSLISIGIALFITLLQFIIAENQSGGKLILENYEFRKILVSCIIIGLGFGIPTVLYENDKMSTVLSSVIHMGIGLSILSIVLYVNKWIPVENGIFPVLVVLGLNALVAIVVWFVFYINNKNLAKKMNEKLNSK